MKLPKREINSHSIIKIVFRVSFAAFVLSILGQMFFTNTLAVKGEELVQLSNRKEALVKEISDLEYEDSLISSLKNIEERAQKLGFVPYQGSLLAIKPAPATSAAVLPSLR